MAKKKQALQNGGKSQKRLSTSERRTQLLEGALAAAAHAGIGRVTHAAIARECGVSVPTVFGHFKSRTALVTAVIEEVKRFYLDQGNQWHRPEILPITAVEGHLRAYAESVRTHSHYAQVWLEWSTAVRNEDGIWDSFLDYQSKMISMISTSVRRGQKDGSISPTANATDAARLVVAAATTITQLHYMRRSKREINRFVEQATRFALSVYSKVPDTEQQ